MHNFSIQILEFNSKSKGSFITYLEIGHKNAIYLGSNRIAILYTADIHLINEFLPLSSEASSIESQFQNKLTELTSPN